MTMSRENVEQTVRDYLCELGGDGGFEADDDLLEVGALQSVHVVELVLFVEAAFGVELLERDVYEGGIATLSKIVAIVCTRMAA